jgi:hypothetical protein
MQPPLQKHIVFISFSYYTQKFKILNRLLEGNGD